MTNRQRYFETILFGNPDKIPLAIGGPRESTLKAWKSQGMDRPYNDALADTLGLPKGAFLGMNRINVSTRMIPDYEPIILEHRDGHYLVRDHMGATVEISDQFDPSYLRYAKDFVTRKWHKHPVENRDDWLKMKERYNPEAPERFPPNFAEQCTAQVKDDKINSLTFEGIFWQLREWCGLENLCIMMIDEPDLVHEMADFWTGFISSILKKICSRAQLDSIVINEDMAYKAHCMISQEMTREFMKDAYCTWVSILKKGGCRVMEVDSDGCVSDLFPFWMETGINCNSPQEVAAYNDLVGYRRLYGKNIAFKGGIDKRIMARGGKELEQHISGIVPEMFKLGGYIPGCDHGVPPDISWKNYVETARHIAKLSGWL